MEKTIGIYKNQQKKRSYFAESISDGLRRFYMKMFFNGNKYNFEMIYKEFNRNKCSWTLKAICKKTNCYSGINNLNPVLSELGIDEDTICGRFEDSSAWKVSKREMKNFNKIAKSFLTSKK